MKLSFVAPSGRQIDYAWSEGPEGRDGRGTWVKAAWEDQAFPVQVRIALDPATEDIAATGLRLGPSDEDLAASSITARSLRALPFTDILFGLQRLTQVRGHVRSATGQPQMVAESLGFPAPTVYRAAHVHPGPRGRSREHYEEVARLYNEIREHNPHSPMAELAKRLHYSLPQVRRWVVEAERMGVRVNRPGSGRRQRQIARLQAALVFKGMSEKEALELLAREKGYTPPPESTLFDAPARLLDYLLGELEKLPEIDLPVHIDPKTGEVVEGEDPAQGDGQETKEEP
jgi:hypothetical protein